MPLKKGAGCVRSPAGALAAKVGSGEQDNLAVLEVIPGSLYLND